MNNLNVECRSLRRRSSRFGCEGWMQNAKLWNGSVRSALRVLWLIPVLLPLWTGSAAGEVVQGEAITECRLKNLIDSWIERLTGNITQDPWSYYSADKYVVDKETFHSGKQSLRLNATDKSKGYGTYTGTAASDGPVDSVEFGTWAKVDPALPEGSRIRVYAQIYLKGGVLLENTALFKGGGTEWRFTGARVPVGGKEIERVLLHLIIENYAGTVWFDDAYLGYEQTPLKKWDTLIQGSGLAAHWDFNEGSGTVLHDRSGNGNNGAIHNAVWVKEKGRGALKFDGSGDYVDCGKTAVLNKLTGDITIVAWVKLAASPFPNGNTNWYIVDCESSASGYMLRVDGGTSKLTYRSYGTVAVSKTKLENNTVYMFAVVKKGNTATFYIDTAYDIQFEARDHVPAPGKSFTISSVGQSFHGLIDDLRIYKRALSPGELVTQYKATAAAHGKDTAWFDKIRLSPYFYFDEGKVVVEANFAGVLPIQADEELVVELGRPGQKPIEERRVTTIPDSGESDFTFAVGNLPAGDYAIRAVVKSADKVRAEESVSFRYPPPPPAVPSPADKVVAPLSQPPEPVPYTVAVKRDGGFIITVNGKGAFPVESAFSYPNGGENTFLCSSERPTGAESSWRVRTRQVGPSEFRITGAGRFYAIDRQVLVTPTHVTVKDTISNKTPEAIGIILTHRMPMRGRKIETAYASGHASTAHIATRRIAHNPTLFLARKGLGLGFVALDDVFIVQSKAFFNSNTAGILTDSFALDANASYTLEWALYLNSSGDYYNFINEIRKDEGRNNVTAEGGFAFITRGTIPTREFVELRNLKYLSLSCLAHATDDPQVSIEGIEFMDFPKEMAVIKDQFSTIHKEFPHLKLMFHIAHSLYTTNKPDQKFPDSRLIRADGKQAIYYENQEGPYFSDERKAQGWRWWVYYPTPGNSFHDALMKSVDVMVDELGCSGAFIDGFLGGYGGEYTYDRWDGHTAEMDPQTKTIERKIGSVPLLAQASMAAFSRKLLEKGGMVVASNTYITRTIGRLPIIYKGEVTEGPGLHLAPTCIVLGNPYAIFNEQDVHQDVINKLKWGNLYFYYGEKGLTYPSAPAQMYPITLEEIHSGYVKGRERLVTIHPGAYGWQGENDLHFAYLYNARGRLTTNNFITTADAAGVRTQVDLSANQIVILKKIPVTLKAAGPVNVLVEKYDKDGIRLILNGAGSGEIIVRGGEFSLKPGTTCRVQAKEIREVAADAAGVLSVLVTLDGQLEVAIEPAILGGRL